MKEEKESDVMKEENGKKAPVQNSERKVETEDISSSGSRGERIKKFFMKNNKRNLKIAVTVACVVLALLLIAGGIFVANKLGLIEINAGFGGNEDDTFAPEEQFEAMYDVSDASDIDNLLEQWATNGGAKYSSKNVINVLLLGVDSETGKSDSGRSDVIMLLSLNKKTKKIKLVSFLRDSYTYMNINGQGRCCKTNHSYFWGGPATLIETLENNYKIEIDHYISVDFKSFPKLIDALGGVTVPVEPYEAEYINRTTTKIDKVQSGDAVKLNGAQALVFSRIRYVDSAGDVGRTGRQRLIIMALIKSAQNASAGQINNAMNIVLPNVVTNYKKTEILSLLTQALSQGWMDYKIEQLVMPSEGNYTSAQLWTYYAKIAGHPLSVWVIDYPVVARELQLALYGDTNINIGSDHVSAVDLLKQGATPNPNYSGGGSANKEVNETVESDITTGEYSSDEITSESEAYYETEVEESETSGRFPDISDITLPSLTVPDITTPWNRNTDPDEDAA